MTDLIFQLTGGIGLFLLGMVLLTDGIKDFAGDSLRRALMRFTGTPFKAFVSGTLVTLLVQSSSATTVTVIGFVSAGLLTFPQALGVVFGASLGTTGTGWLIALVGLKINLGFYALPLVGVGALARLLARGRRRALGMALAGFGLIFIGIDTMQEGMQSLSGIINLAAIPATGARGHLIAMLAGAVMTVIMQSSSAATATTLTALHSGTVNFEQAASLVIGAAIGTTVTGVLAALGGSVPTKRTALAHVLFNLSTGLIAVLMLPALLRLIQQAQQHLGLDPGAVSLAAFHSLFILAGVVLFLPFVRPFARAIEWLLPDRGPPLTRHLDKSLLATAPVAIEAVRRALLSTAEQLLDALIQRLPPQGGEPGNGVASTESETAEALVRISDFLARTPETGQDEPLGHARLSLVHAMDHLERLHGRLNPPPGACGSLTDADLSQAVEMTRQVLHQSRAGLHPSETGDSQTALEQASTQLADERRRLRASFLQATATGHRSPDQAANLLDAVNWLDHSGYHAWRASAHLAAAVNGGQPSSIPVEQASAGSQSDSRPETLNHS